MACQDSESRSWELVLWLRTGLHHKHKRSSESTKSRRCCCEPRSLSQHVSRGDSRACDVPDRACSTNCLDARQYFVNLPRQANRSRDRRCLESSERVAHSLTRLSVCQDSNCAWDSVTPGKFVVKRIVRSVVRVARQSRVVRVSPVTRTHLKQVPRSVRRVWLCRDDVT